MRVRVRVRVSSRACTFLYQDAEVSAAEPATGPITGETPVRLTGDGFVATPSLRVRFTRVEPLEGTPAYLEVEPLPLPLPLPYPPLPLPLPLPLTLTLALTLALTPAFDPNPDP